MPKYLLLIYDVPATEDVIAERQAEMPRWFSYTEDIAKDGGMIAGEALDDIATATTVRVRDGETLLTDGPFAETRELLGGFYLIDVPDLDAALAWASRMPNIGRGSVEVRPVLEFSAMPPA